MTNESESNLYRGKYQSILKLMNRARQNIQAIFDHVSDEGDRVYFGSTNHKDWLRDLLDHMDRWAFDAILPAGDLNKMESDPYADIRNLRQQTVNLAEQNAELKEQLFNTVTQLSEQMQLVAQQSATLDSLDKYIQENIGQPEVSENDDALAIAYPKGAQRVIGQRQGYGVLPVIDRTFDCPVNGPNTPLMITCWLPTSEQIDRLMGGAAISVQLIGTDHPPIVVAIGPAP